MLNCEIFDLYYLKIGFYQLMLVHVKHHLHLYLIHFGQYIQINLIFHLNLNQKMKCLILTQYHFLIFHLM
jgi:hypothetical protein